MKIEINFTEDEECLIVGSPTALKLLSEILLEVSDLGVGYSITDSLSFDNTIDVQCVTG